MTPEFSVADQSTWPLVMFIEQIAELYGRSAKAIRTHCDQGRFIPAPFINRPYRWRRADVVRHVEGARGSTLRQVVGR
jgi:hypothetical protein